VEAAGRITRRGFLGVVGGAGIVLCGPGISGGSVPRRAEGGGDTLDKGVVVKKLRGRIKGLLGELEARTALAVEFRRLGRDFEVVAQYSFEQPSRPIVHLRDDWEDVDVAHELMHMKLELVDGFCVLAWRKGVERDKAVEKAFGLIRSYVDDAVVFERLARMGLRVDGEVIKRQFFDEICTRVARYLRDGRSEESDGMAHLDRVGGGRYGGLRRSTFLVQAELIKKHYRAKLGAAHRRVLDDFISTFRLFRREQAANADRVLGYFAKYNVQQRDGHARILVGWAELEGLERWVGLSRYVRRAGGFILPYPSVEAALSGKAGGR